MGTIFLASNPAMTFIVFIMVSFPLLLPYFSTLLGRLHCWTKHVMFVVFECPLKFGRWNEIGGNKYWRYGTVFLIGDWVDASGDQLFLVLVFRYLYELPIPAKTRTISGIKNQHFLLNEDSFPCSVYFFNPIT